MATHGGGDGRILEDLLFLMVAVVSIELEGGTSGFILLTSDCGRRLLVRTEL